MDEGGLGPSRIVTMLARNHVGHGIITPCIHEARGQNNNTPVRCEMLTPTVS